MEKQKRPHHVRSNLSIALMAAVALVVVFALAVFLVLAPSNAQAAVVTFGLDTNSSGAAPSIAITRWALATVEGDGMSDIQFAIPDGNTLELRIEVKADSASEEVASDFFQAAGMHWSLVLGDMNGDFNVTVADVPLLILALVNRPAYDALLFPVNPNLNGDVNQDGTFDTGDLGPFSAIPEPGSALLALLAMSAWGFIPRRRKSH